MEDKNLMLYRIDTIMVNDDGENIEREFYIVSDSFGGAFEIFRSIKMDYSVLSITITEEEVLTN